MKRIPHSRYQPCIPTLRMPGVSTMYKGPGVPFMLWLTALLILPGAGSGTQVSQDRPGSAQPQSIHVNSGPRQVALLELFTSEGCSSCPPADRWLSGLIDDPRLWRELVPVAFHVDYWDYLGWPDRFASREFSRRQRDHARSGGLSQVYTPGVVLNGAEWRGWHRGRPLPTASDMQGADPGRLSLEIHGPRLRARLATVVPLEQPRLHLVVLGFDLESQVAAGENRGRALRHDFVVLAHAVHGLNATSDGELGFTGALPTSASLHEHPDARLAVAAWVSDGASPVPLQAAGGWLRPAR